MKHIRRALLGAALSLAPIVALAQSNYPSVGGATVPATVQECLNSSGQAVPVSNGTCANPAQVTATLSGALPNNADAVATVATGLSGVDSYNFVFNGTTWDRQRGDLTGGAWIQGAVASGATDTGNPVKIGAKYNATLPSPADGQRVDIQVDAKGGLFSVIKGAGSTNANAAAVNSIAGDANNPQQSLFVNNIPLLWNTGNYDRQRAINGAVAAGTGTAAVAIAPTSSAAGGITPVVSAAAENNHVLKATAGNVYSASATNLTATAGFLVLLNATTSPADGAITPLACAPLPANGVATVNYAGGSPPAVFATGIVAVVTSANACFTKTTGVITAFISGQVQ